MRLQKSSSGVDGALHRVADYEHMAEVAKTGHAEARACAGYEKRYLAKPEEKRPSKSWTIFLTSASRGSGDEAMCIWEVGASDGEWRP